MFQKFWKIINHRIIVSNLLNWHYESSFGIFEPINFTNLSRFWRHILWRHRFPTLVEMSNSAPMLAAVGGTCQSCFPKLRKLRKLWLIKVFVLHKHKSYIVQEWIWPLLPSRSCQVCSAAIKTSILSILSQYSSGQYSSGAYFYPIQQWCVFLPIF